MRKLSLPERSTTFLGVAVVVLAMFGGCSLDPVQNGSIQALGDEDPAIPQGKYHRAGQPCVLCHSTTGPASDKPFAVAGTVFVDPFGRRGSKQTWVRVRDGENRQVCKTTNCKGNFFITDDEFGSSFDGKAGPAFPLLVSVHRSLPGNPSGKFRAMQSHIGRDGSCAGCHRPAPPAADGKAVVASFDTPGVVRLYETEAEAKAGIPEDPNDLCPPAAEEVLIPCPEDLQ